MATDGDVDTLLSFINYRLDKDEAKRLLAIMGNNVETALMKFFDEDIANLKTLLKDSKPNWDDTAFGAGRYGNEDTTGSVPST